MKNCSVADIIKMVSDKVFDKTIKPLKFTVETVVIPVYDWTELSKEFVRWLIEKGHLKKENLPIHNHANRGKYFINSEPVHEYAEKDGYWCEVNSFYVDTKYNAEHHVKNIISSLAQLGVYNPDIKFSFRQYWKSA